MPDHFAVANIFTSMFLHGGWLHVLGNMWFLWIFGDNVEDILGHGKFLLFYLLCGMAAALAQVLFNSIRACPWWARQGAIAGVMGAYMVKFPRARIVTFVFVFFFITTVRCSGLADADLLVRAAALRRLRQPSRHRSIRRAAARRFWRTWAGSSPASF